MIDVTPLRRLFRVVNGGTPTSDERNWDGGIAWITPEDLGDADGGRIASSRRTLTRAGIVGSNAIVSPAGSLVVSTRAPIGYVAELTVPAATNQGCRTLVPRVDMDVRFFKYAMLSIRGDLVARGQGSTFRELSSSALASSEVPAPDLLRQRAIVDFLDRETARLDSLIERKERTAHLARERFSAQVESRTGPAGGPLVPIRRLVSAVTTGSRDWSDLVLDGDGYFIRATNLSRHSTDPDLAHEKLARLQPPRTAEAQRAMLQSGDVLVCVTGYPGSVAFWAGQLAPAFVSQHVAALRPAAGTLGQWMAFALLAPSVQAQITARQYGGTKQGLGLDDLKELRVTLTSPTQQAIVAAELADAQANTDALVAYCDRQVDLLREKRQALITAAVTGQVTMSGAA